MIVVSNSSPLITLAKLDLFHLPHMLFGEVFISQEVHNEVVKQGGEMPGAVETRKASWIRVRENR